MNYNVKSYQIYLFFLCALVIFSCKQSKRPDVSGIKIAIKIQRFDQDLYQNRTKRAQEADSLLTKKYGAFYGDFITRMVGTPNLSGVEVLKNLYKGKAYADLQHEVDSVYPKLDQVESELTETFQYIRYYYPKVKIPRFISFLSGFAYQIPIGENYMGIGLDMFLGKDSKFYPALIQSIPRYQSRRFEPSYIVPRITEEFAKEELFKPNDEDQTLLSQMIYQGKILYFMDQVLPEHVSDSVKIGYTARQMAWVKKFEGNIWGVLLEKELLYNTDFRKIQVYITDGPYTVGLGDKTESAPKLGVWIGWQMVKKYMAENPKVTLQHLMADNDAQKILTKSKYKPKIKE
ncbi:gliding motility lipoprotein GldB [Pedobacter sp. Du54]|uniref:gliding motility lipoprotein GldB n=1 Tax=Pedobacter anseongensis TaxID=3133439 RepID=UPI0030B68F3A